MNCENHEMFVSKIAKIDSNVEKLSDKLDAKLDIIENKIDSKFESLTTELLKSNKELCNSIIDLNTKSNSNKKEITKSRNILVNGTIASIAGIIGALITKLF